MRISDWSSDVCSSDLDYLKGSQFWHFDGSLQPSPNLAALLRAVKLSDVGGQTEVCNTYAAYDDLPDDLQRQIEPLRVVHSAERSQRSEELRVGKECVSTWRSRGAPGPIKKQID